MRVCTCDFFSLRIFIVEDHKDTLDALRKYLEQLGHIVLSASSKGEALKQIPMADCHVLISDIGLPDGNGWELMQELENFSPRYAIAVSGYGMKADREMSAEAGFRHHLVKPLLPHKLDSLLEEASIELKKEG